MKSVMTASHNFSQIPKADIPRSVFDRSSGLKTTFDADELIPIYCDEIVPGDTVNMKATLFARLATPINPIMDNMYLDTFWFFVPNRLVWDNFVKMMGEQHDPADSTDFTVPMRGTALTPSVGDLTDYFGLPTGVDIGTGGFNVLPLRAYWLIWNEWFRDQNLQDSNTVTTDDTGVVTDGTWNTPAKRGKRHDYFTSCLPWAQKGTQVTVPLGESAPVSTDAAAGADLSIWETIGSSYNVMSAAAANLQLSAVGGTEGNSMYADLSAATGASINAWRQAFQIQKFMERDARSGTRYQEKILAHFGVQGSDARLQRPEYLGGSSAPINISPVAQTSSTDVTTPQGNLSAFGTVLEKNSGFVKSFSEHGYLICIANVRADLTYQQGMDRMWSRSTVYDHYFPAFAHLGEQAVLSKEIYLDGTAGDTTVFGYQERFAEMRYKPSKITGQFRSQAASSLDPWHLSEEFSVRPTLSSTFIESNTPLDRCIAVPAEPHFIMDGYFKCRHVRPMPTYSTPGLIDHF